ncbi:hypothetical protein [Streptomyces sp. NPDC048560]|uniref:hypothetical protein n=1 Tax=Streptomyces sp. NPDC048560 TaxID=3155488 RepID=UPI003443E6E5
MEADGTGQAGPAQRTYEPDGRGQFHGHRRLAAHREVEHPVRAQLDQPALGIAPVDPPFSFGLESGALI